MAARIHAGHQAYAARQILERNGAWLNLCDVVRFDDLVGLIATIFRTTFSNRRLLGSWRLGRLRRQVPHLPLQLPDLLLKNAYAAACADDKKEQENRAADEEQAGKKDHRFHAWRPTNEGGGDYYMRMPAAPAGTIACPPCLVALWRFTFIMPA